MDVKEDKRFFLAHKKSSALVVSIIIHAVFIMVALSFVAINIYVKPEEQFKAPEVKRPNMKLRKLQVPVKESKRSQAPKLRKMIVAKPKMPTVNIKMPEVIGVKGAMGSGLGSGLGSLGFGLEIPDLFGASRGGGNEFEGAFYDLKQTPDGKTTDIGERAMKDPFNYENQLAACKIIRGLVSSGFNEARLKDYFKAPKVKFATAFMMPRMWADAAPKAFAVEDKVKPSYWLCLYKGQIAAPETGKYRFCGLGDDILVVRVDRKVVLDASWPELIERATSWRSQDDNNRKFPIGGVGNLKQAKFLDVFSQIDKAGGYGNRMRWGDALRGVKVNDRPIDAGTEVYMNVASRMVIGDWVSLRKGQPVDVDILIGEIPGGEFTCRLLIEQEGKQYKMIQTDAGPRPVLPVFKTTPVNEKLVSQMGIEPSEMTLDGPVFGVLINKP